MVAIKPGFYAICICYSLFYHYQIEDHFPIFSLSEKVHIRRIFITNTRLHEMQPIFVSKVIKTCAAGQKLCFFSSGSLERDFKTTNKNLVSASQSLLNTAGNYMFKVNNRNTRTRCEICSKLTLKIPEQRHWCRCGVFTVNFEHISHLVLVFLLLTLSR